MVSASPWKDVLHAGTPPKMSYALFAFAIAFMSIAFWLIFEITISVFRYFKKKRGLYFYSLLISAWGTFFHTLGYVTQWWAPSVPWWVNTCFILFGWSTMITFQSLVLYSRLHLVIMNRGLLRGVLWLIISTAIFIQIPQWVATWGATVNVYSVTKYWSPIDSIMVRISQAVFLLQEGFLSCLYIWGAVKLLAPNVEIKVRKVMWELIAISAFLIVMDIIILTLAYTNLHIPKEPVQNFAYALKLKLEFVILNQLLAVLHRNRGESGGNRYVYDSRKKSGSDAPLKGASYGVGSPDVSDRSKEKFGSSEMVPKASSRAWHTTNDSCCDDSPTRDTEAYSEFMRQNQGAYMRQAMEKDNTALVTHDVDVVSHPPQSARGRR